MTTLSAAARARGADALVVLAAAASALEVALHDDPVRAPRSAAWLAAPAIALVVLTLLGRRRFPFGAPAALWVLAAGLSFADGRLVPFAAPAIIAGIAAAYLLGQLEDVARARLGLLVVLAGAVAVVLNDPNRDAGELVVTPLFFVVGWLGGSAMRERAARADAAELRALLAEREREAGARVAVAEERARIARELHDVVAHAVSVMVLQVGAVRHGLAGASAEDREALERVERAGRAALTEMRRLLGAMRREDEEVELSPQPGLGDLGAMAAQVERAGLRVRVRESGEPYALPPGVDLSAYRIVQEGLTNALKHARARQAEVTLRYAARELHVEVRDDGRGAVDGDGEGHGLVGVRERVKLYGGELEAGPGRDGGFVLRARLPVEDQAP